MALTDSYDSSRIENRRWNVEIKLKDGSTLKSGTSVSSENPQRVVFNIQYAPNANVGWADITLYGFSADTIHSQIEKGAFVSFSAGYEGSESRIFAGEIFNVYHMRSGVENFIKIYAQSLNQSSAVATISKTWGQGTPYRVILAECMVAMQALGGFIPDDLSRWDKLMGNVGPSGYSYAGRAIDLARQITKQFGVNLYLYSGGKLETDGDASSQYFITMPGVSPSIGYHLISDITGMEGSPVFTSTGVTVSKRIDTAIYPQDKIKVESGYFSMDGIYQYAVSANEIMSSRSGDYCVETIAYRGDSDSISGQAWTMTISARIPIEND